MASWTSPTYRFDQLVAPVTTWFPTVVNYQGDPVIERRIAEEIASFGKQLGIVSDTLLEFADGIRGGPHLERLRDTVCKIEALKARQHASLVDETTRSFEALARANPDKAHRLLGTLADLARDAADRKAKEDRA
jgi:hypothetical protein